MPGDQRLAVVAVKRDLRGLRQAGCGRRRVAGVGEIYQLALEQIHQHQQRAVADDDEDEQPFPARSWLSYHRPLKTRADRGRHDGDGFLAEALLGGTTA